jgi:hypothetical protein
MCGRPEHQRPDAEAAIEDGEWLEARSGWGSDAAYTSAPRCSNSSTAPSSSAGENGLGRK